MWERSAPFSLPYMYLDERPPGRNVHKNTPDHCKKKIQVSLCCEKSLIWNVIAHARTCCGSVRAHLAQHSHITVFFLKFFLRSCFLHKPWFHFCYNSSSFGISVALCAGTVGKNTPVHLKNRFYVEYGLWRIIQSLYCCVEGKTVTSRRNVILIKNLTYLGVNMLLPGFLLY